MLPLASIESFVDPESGNLMTVGETVTRLFTSETEDTVHVMALTAVKILGGISIFARFRKLKREPTEGEDLNSIPYLWATTSVFAVSEEELSELKTTEFKFPSNTEN